METRDDGFVMPKDDTSTNDYVTMLTLLTRAADEKINGMKMGEVRRDTWREGLALVFTSLVNDVEVWHYFKGNSLFGIRVWDK